jgi:hypothetical protein
MTSMAQIKESTNKEKKKEVSVQENKTRGINFRRKGIYGSTQVHRLIYPKINNNNYYYYN